jgi:Family of unknown function (DUF6399)
MLPQQPTADVAPCQDPFRWPRSQAVALLEQALHQDDPSSLGAFADEQDVPRSTLHYWRHRRDHLDTSGPLRDFFESPAGLDFLQRLVLAAHLAFQQPGGVGIRSLSIFFELVQLQPFLACSYGAQQHLASDVQSLIVQYGQAQPRRLAPTMPVRKISLCEDENFHQGPPCLVAIEPVSNFLVVETCSAKRDAASWDRAVAKGLEGLPVQVIQVGSDLAPGIIAHAKDGLGAHHSPDLMHAQQGLHRATSLPLQSRVKQAEQHEEQAELHAFQACFDRAMEQEEPPKSGRPLDFDRRIDSAKEQWHQAQQATADAQQRQQQTKEAIRGLGDDYHPFTATGTAHSEQTLEQQLSGRLSGIEQSAQQARLSPECVKKIGAARKVLSAWLATLSWFWSQVAALLESTTWTAEEKELFKHKVLAWQYWLKASARGRDAEHKQSLREVAKRCQEAVEADPLWARMAEEQKQEMLALAQECAGRWVRSSSCVEGRNGYLSLRHHGRRGLSAKGLAALTVLHNYWIRRPDGTTAAQRFFAQEPDDLFEWLLERFPELPRPARSRKQAA